MELGYEDTSTEIYTVDSQASAAHAVLELCSTCMLWLTLGLHSQCRQPGAPALTGRPALRNHQAGRELPPTPSHAAHAAFALAPPRLCRAPLWFC